MELVEGIDRVGIVLVNWNGASDTIQCIESIVAQETDVQIHVVVVDNASTDNSPHRITSSCMQLGVPVERRVMADNSATGNQNAEGTRVSTTILEATENLGFCKANNLGADIAFSHDADWVLILNNDTMLDRSAVDQLVQAAEVAGDESVLSPQILYEARPSEIWWCGGTFDSFLRPKYLRQGDKRLLDSPTILSTEWVSGCATFISRNAYSRLGLYDPIFFIWCEEWDLSLRAIQRGFSLNVAPRAVVFHKVGRSLGIVSPLTFFYSMRNMMILRGRHLSLLRSLGVLLLFLPMKFLSAVRLWLRHRDPSYLWAFMDALRATRSGGIWPRQQRVGPSGLLGLRGRERS